MLKQLDIFTVVGWVVVLYTAVLLHNIYKINLNWIMDLNVKGETINLIEDNTGEYLWLWIGMDFEGAKSMNHKEKNR